MWMDSLDDGDEASAGKWSTAIYSVVLHNRSETVSIYVNVSWSEQEFDEVQKTLWLNDCYSVFPAAALK